MVEVFAFVVAVGEEVDDEEVSFVFAGECAMDAAVEAAATLAIAAAAAGVAAVEADLPEAAACAVEVAAPPPLPLLLLVVVAGSSLSDPSFLIFLRGSGVALDPLSLPLPDDDFDAGRLLLRLFIPPFINWISAFGSIVQNAPFPGSASPRGTLTNALFSDKLCLIEFYRERRT